MAGSTRFGTAVAALLAVGIAASPAARADMAMVQQDATPIASQPGVGGYILTRVDAGFRVIVLGRDGEWLRVSCPELTLTGNLWIPAGRVGDIVATPADLALLEGVPATAEAPRFRIMTDGAGGTSVTGGGNTAAAGSRGDGAATDARAASGTAAGSAAQTSRTASAAAAAATTSGTPASNEGNPAPAVGNAVSSSGDSTSANNGDSTPAVGNTNPAVGNTTPAVGNTTPAVGNSTPAMGDVVGGFGARAAAQ